MQSDIADLKTSTLLDGNAFGYPTQSYVTVNTARGAQCGKIFSLVVNLDVTAVSATNDWIDIITLPHTVAREYNTMIYPWMEAPSTKYSAIRLNENKVSIRPKVTGSYNFYMTYILS